MTKLTSVLAMAAGAENVGNDNENEIANKNEENDKGNSGSNSSKNSYI